MDHNLYRESEIPCSFIVITIKVQVIIFIVNLVCTLIEHTTRVSHPNCVRFTVVSIREVVQYTYFDGDIILILFKI